MALTLEQQVQELKREMGQLRQEVRRLRVGTPSPTWTIGPTAGPDFLTPHQIFFAPPERGEDGELMGPHIGYDPDPNSATAGQIHISRDGAEQLALADFGFRILLSCGWRTGYQVSVTTSWVTVGAVRDPSAVMAYQASFMPLPSTAQHRLLIIAQDDTAGADVEVRLVAGAAVIATKTGISILGRYAVSHADFTTANIPTIDSQIEVEWRRAAGTGNATIHAVSWVVKL